MNGETKWTVHDAMRSMVSHMNVLSPRKGITPAISV